MTQAPSIKKALELLPCPFCGGEPAFNKVTYSERMVKEQEWGQDTFHGVNCVMCGVSNLGLVGHKDQERAAAIWNTRAALATLQPSGERREAIARIIDPAAFGHVTGRETASWRAWNDSRNALALKTADRILASGLVQDEAGWRDISTAPKDGTVIDVWLGDADGSDLDFYCQSRTCKRSANWYWSNGKFRPFTGLDLPLTTFVEPTHWIPLPAPPIRSARNGGAS